jgi:hypothetical protein
MATESTESTEKLVKEERQVIFRPGRNGVYSRDILDMNA